MERSQKNIHRKDELTWPAHILTCSPHVLSHVLALNGTSLLAVTCPCKTQAGWPFWCPYRNVVFFGLEPCTGKPTLESHRSKLGLRSLNAKIQPKTTHQYKALVNNHIVCRVYSSEPGAAVYCVRLNFNISKLVYLVGLCSMGQFLKQMFVI